VGVLGHARVTGKSLRANKRIGLFPSGTPGGEEAGLGGAQLLRLAADRDREVDRILAGLRGEQLRRADRIEEALGQQACAFLRALDAQVANVTELEQAMTEAFEQHPDAEIITSFPGLGPVLGRSGARRDR
jgi:hypothetical protein